MALTYSELLTRRFYEWESRGRGWYVSDEPVDIEPPFYPFYGHYISAPPSTDDSKKPTWISRFIDLLNKKEPEPEYIDSDIPPLEPQPMGKDEPLNAIGFTIPKETSFSIDDMKELLLMLSDSLYHVSFEIIINAENIQFQIVCRESDLANVYSQLRAYVPGIDVRIISNKLPDQIPVTEGLAMGEFGLADEFMFPLRSVTSKETDPFNGLFAALDQMKQGESVMIQIMFKGVMNPWGESIIRAASNNDGGSFFVNAPNFLKEAQEKVSAPLFAVCIRVAAFAPDGYRALDLLLDTSVAIERITTSQNNRVFLAQSPNLTLDDLLTNFFHRKSNRLGMLLNSNELSTLVHFPTEDVRSAKLSTESRKTKAMPAMAMGHELYLGINEHNGYRQFASVPPSLRLRHTHIIGATGTGKSTLFLSMICQDLKNGNGLAVLDPHGDLIESILPYIPHERIEDVVIVDPSDAEYPVAFNILSAHSEIEKDILSSDLVAAFKRLSSSWGDQMNSVLANAILAFLESNTGGTLLDLRRFLVEKDFREAYLKSVTDPHIVYYWQHEYPLLKSSSIGSILTRLDTFLRPKVIRNMVAQKHSLDFENIMDSKKILLVKLSQGLIGTENSYLLGTFFVTKIYQAAMARQIKSKSERTDFYLYIDEFQNFITPSMSHILSGARKYHLGLILAHQDMQQVSKHDTELASSVTVNPGTRICFRLGDVDAKRFASGFSYFDANDLENLRVGEAIVRFEQPNLDFSIKTIPLPVIDQQIASANAGIIIAKSRKKYGTQCDEVEPNYPRSNDTGINQVSSSHESSENRPSSDSVQIPQPFVPVEVPRTGKQAKKTETQHRFLQTLVKKMAESRGYKAIIESITPDGNGRVDVSLEKGEKRIACEISVTTGDEWETHNAEKCLSAGYDEVIVCSTDRISLQRIKEKLEKNLSPTQFSKLILLEPQELMQYFDLQIEKESGKKKVVKGYRVKVEFDNTTNHQKKKG